MNDPVRSVLFVAMMCAAVGVGPAVAEAQQRPQFDPDEEIVCAEREDGTKVRLQCDHDALECLEAQPYIVRSGEPTDEVAPSLERCRQGEPGVYERLQEQGYEMIPARLEAPHGFSRDRNGRLFQTNFDLRRRAYLGVSNRMRFDLGGGEYRPAHHAVTLEMGGIQDYYDIGDDRRRRRQYLQGRWIMAPLELDLQFLRFDSVPADDDSGFWIATPFGELRFDIPIRVGFGTQFARFHYRFTDAGSIMLLDLAGVHMNWEIFQGAAAENYALIRFGLGGGIRHLEGQSGTPFYLYPEVGLESAWTIGGRGLTQLRVDARVQPSVELRSGDIWVAGRGGLMLEQLIFAVTDNPITLFVNPEVRYDRLGFADVEGVDYRLLAGARFSTFVGPRPAEEELEFDPTPAPDPDPGPVRATLPPVQEVDR